jgi:hypothetical protein
MQLEAEKRRPQSRGRPTLSSSFQSDREDRNDFVATVDDDDLVADHEVPESPPLRMDVHDDRGDLDHPHARWHRGTHAHREVDVAGPRYIAAGQDRLSDLGALLRRQGRASARLALLTLLALLALLSLAGLSLPLLTALALLTLLSLRGLTLGLVSLLALRLRLLVLLPLALARGLIALLLFLTTLLGLTLLAAILLRALITLTLGRLARGLALLSALRLALLLLALLLSLRALLRLPLHVMPALGLAARSGL